MSEQLLSNDPCKLVAQSKEMIDSFMKAYEVPDDSYLKDAIILLDMALDRLTKVNCST